MSVLAINLTKKGANTQVRPYIKIVSLMKLENVSLSKIDFQDRDFFAGSFKPDISSLKKSIRQVGLINPPILRKKGEDYQIICGWRRLLVCNELGLDEVLSKVYSSDEITDIDCLMLISYDNKERLNYVEKSEILFKFTGLCKLDEIKLIEEVLPHLGISPARRNFKRYIRVAELESEIKDAFYSETVTEDQVFLLSEIEDRTARIQIFKKVLLGFRFNKNETREVLREIPEVAFRDKMTVGEVIDKITAKIEGSGQKTDFRHELKLMRFPALTKVRELFGDYLTNMNLPKEINVFHHPFFEDNHIEFRIKVEDNDRFSELLSYLNSVAEEGKIAKLLRLIREGK